MTTTFWVNASRVIQPSTISIVKLIFCEKIECAKLWMFKCAAAGCAVVKARVVSDADNRRKTCAT